MMTKSIFMWRRALHETQRRMSYTALDNGSSTTTATNVINQIDHTVKNNTTNTTNNEDAKRNIRRFVDIGANLLDAMFTGVYHGRQRHPDDGRNVFQRAARYGVTNIMITAGTIEETHRAIEMCEQTDGDGTAWKLRCTAGVHPTRAQQICPEGRYTKHTQKYIQELRTIIQTDRAKKVPHIAAFGEIGLDYERLHFSDKAMQMAAFNAQMELVGEMHMPLFLHDRNSEGDLLKVLKSHKQRHCGVVHSFDGCLELAHAYIELGLFIGINGCSLKTQKNLDVVKALPLTSLMLESDAPWCSIKNSHASKVYVRTNFASTRPEKHTVNTGNDSDVDVIVKDRCEPCMVIQVAEVVAALHGVSVDEVARITTKNATQIFFAD